MADKDNQMSELEMLLAAQENGKMDNPENDPANVAPTTQEECLNGECE